MNSVTRDIVTGSYTTTYMEQGEGTPILLLHGSGAGVSAAANWTYALETLSSGYRVIAPDLVGFGATIPDAEFSYGVDAWVEQVALLLDALDVPTAHVVGNSLGGWVTLHCALKFPERLDSLILMGCAGALSEYTPEILAKVTFDRSAHENYRPSEAAMRQLLGDFVVDPNVITRELVRSRYEATAASGAEERWRDVVSARDRDVLTHGFTDEQLSSITKPTLLIHGREDRIIPIDASLRLLDLMPNADLQVFANCGHWTMIEHADRFNRSVAHFVTDQVAGLIPAGR